MSGVSPIGDNFCKVDNIGLWIGILLFFSVMHPFSVGELLSSELWFVNNDIPNAIYFRETIAKSNNCYKRDVPNST